MTTSKPAMPGPVVLIVYGREHCHLCQDMVARLHELQTKSPFRLEVIDVDSDATLAARYGEWIPVLVANGEEICHYHLDPIALDAYFARIR
jgi:thiol-disulfide isomerase/thioredoxin